MLDSHIITNCDSYNLYIPITEHSFVCYGDYKMQLVYNGGRSVFKPCNTNVNDCVVPVYRYCVCTQLVKQHSKTFNNTFKKNIYIPRKLLTKSLNISLSHPYSSICLW